MIRDEPFLVPYSSESFLEVEAACLEEFHAYVKTSPPAHSGVFQGTIDEVFHDS